MLERKLPDWVRPEDIVWLDDDHAVSWTFAHEDGQMNGGLLWHRKPIDKLSATPGWCVGGFCTRPEGNPKNAPIWTLESKDPITLSPSFLCGGCGHHGFIRNGKWVGA